MGAWTFYRSAGGGSTVSDEINALLPKAGKIKLGALLQRIESGETLRGDVKPLTREIDEARLTWDGREFRLYFARLAQEGQSVLLGLRAVNKKGRKAATSDVDVSEARLSDWRSRFRST
jgi:putative component of toxin-antitoxin plasmid stabilization module